MALSATQWILVVGVTLLVVVAAPGQADTSRVCHRGLQCPPQNGSQRLTSCCEKSIFHGYEEYCCDQSHIWIFYVVGGGMTLTAGLIVVICYFCKGCYLYNQRYFHQQNRRNNNNGITATSAVANTGQYPGQQPLATNAYPMVQQPVGVAMAYPVAAADGDTQPLTAAGSHEEDYPVKPGQEDASYPPAGAAGVVGYPMAQAAYPAGQAAYPAAAAPYPTGAAAPYPTGAAAPYPVGAAGGAPAPPSYNDAIGSNPTTAF